jgi:hypothetical protein
LPSSLTTYAVIATVPSADSVFGSSKTAGAASSDASVYRTAWFWSPSFLVKK